MTLLCSFLVLYISIDNPFCRPTPGKSDDDNDDDVVVVVVVDNEDDGK
jgi:hypothetical protein